MFSSLESLCPTHSSGEEMHVCAHVHIGSSMPLENWSMRSISVFSLRFIALYKSVLSAEACLPARSPARPPGYTRAPSLSFAALCPIARSFLVISLLTDIWHVLPQFTLKSGSQKPCRCVLPSALRWQGSLPGFLAKVVCHTVKRNCYGTGPVSEVI